MARRSQTFSDHPHSNYTHRHVQNAVATKIQKAREWAVTQTGACADDDMGLTRIARYVQRIEHDARCSALLRGKKGDLLNRRDRRSAKHAHVASCEQCQTWGWPKYIERN